jgi:phage shock protein E
MQFSVLLQKNLTMLKRLLSLFSPSKKVDFGELIKEGALVLDVRSKQEFNSGHVKGSINIPLDQLGNNLSKLKKEKTIITVCASGMRSGMAKRMLISKGYTNTHNGGSWYNLS